MILNVLESLANAAIEFAPKALAATILLAIGWAIGSVLGRIIREVVRRTKIDEYIFGKRRPIVRIGNVLAVIVSWSIYLLFIQAAVDMLGVRVLVTAFGQVLAFLPKLIEAIIILIAGYGIAEYVRNQIEESKMEYAGILSNLAFFIIVYVAIATALPLLDIETFLINSLLLIAAGSLGAGFAIAIGLGLKDEMRIIFRRYMRRKRRR